MPTSSYAESMQRIHALRAREAADPRINPDCASIVMEHGQRTPRSIVCMHGITSSPVQFRDLGTLFFERGYNVVIPRMPRHGYRNRLTRDHARLTVAEYQAYVTEAVEIGRGLGEHLTVAGLSVSGVLAAWAAQTRADLDLAVPIAPAFAPRGVPLRLIPALIELMRRLPNLFISWDFRKPVPLAPGCSYPRFSTHALAEAFRLGADVLKAAAPDTRPPRDPFWWSPTRVTGRSTARPREPSCSSGALTPAPMSASTSSDPNSVTCTTSSARISPTPASTTSTPSCSTSSTRVPDLLPRGNHRDRSWQVGRALASRAVRDRPDDRCRLRLRTAGCPDR